MFNIISCGFQPFNAHDSWGFLSLKDKDDTMTKSYGEQIRLV
ncbi:hypothetical protein [Paenibacillus pabuli]|nr:hypothetical protein [Paenibacillus pabuli]MEC0126356.1 hypothetical protein [Paenibacillus pabuli]